MNYKLLVVIFIILIIITGCIILGVYYQNNENKQDLNCIHNDFIQLFQKQLSKSPKLSLEETNEELHNQLNELKQKIDKVEETIEETVDELEEKLEHIHNSKIESFNNKKSNKKNINPIQRVRNNLKNKTIPIYYINLERSPERKEFMEKQFKMYHIHNVICVEAVDGNLLENFNEGVLHLNSTNPTFYKNDYDEGSFSMPELGCTLSHLKAIKMAYSDNCEYAYICEDDTAFTLVPFWVKTIDTIMKEAPSNWTVLQLYFAANACYLDNDVYVDVNDYGTCHSTAIYLINRKGMKNILDKVYHKNVFSLYVPIQKQNEDILLDKQNKISLAADHYIYHIADHTYAYNSEPLFYQYNALSELKSTIQRSDNYHIRQALKSLKSIHRSIKQ